MLFDDMDVEDDEFFDAPEDDAEGSSSAVERDVLQPARAQVNLIGHAEIEKKLLEFISSGKLPQSVIFTGSAGIGKATMAYRLARYLFKYKNTSEEGGLFGGFDAAPPAPTDSLFVAPDSNIFNQVASGGWPDLLTIERPLDDKGKPKVHDLEAIRATTAFFRRTAAQDGGWRIAIIDDADTMNWTAQNALLKILEEPPEKSIIILISHRLGAMLPTILSRAAVINFQPLEDSQIRQFLTQYAPIQTKESEDRIVRMAAGSVGLALYYAEAPRSETIDQAVMIFDGWPSLDWTRIQLFADSIGARGSDEASQAAFRDVMLWVINSLVRAKSLGQGSAAGLENQAFRAILAEYSLARLLKICDTLKQHFDLVQTASLDKRFMVMGAYAAFEQA